MLPLLRCCVTHTPLLPLDPLQSAIEHAVTKHEARQVSEAAKLYRIALDAALEGLALAVPSAGLGG